MNIEVSQEDAQFPEESPAMQRYWDNFHTIRDLGLNYRTALLAGIFTAQEFDEQRRIADHLYGIGRWRQP
jgi:hypothetical protein